jgi:hypothetical protein
MLTISLLLICMTWDDMMRRHPTEVSPSTPVVYSAQSQTPATLPPPPPPPARGPAATTVPPPAAPAATATGPQSSVLADALLVAVEKTRDSRPGTRPRTSQPLLPVAPKAPAPTIWQLADNSGQMWTHADPAWLKQWVSLRNEALSSACASGACASGPCASGACASGTCQVSAYPSANYSNVRQGVPQAPVYYYSPSYSPASSCSGGSCRRR